MLQTIFDNAESKLDHVTKSLQQNLATVRAGQAAPSLIQDLIVEAYGTQMTLKELGAISAPQPNLLVVSCWDDTIVETIAKALQQSNLGVNPVVDGKTIKVPIPQLTDERREAMIKEVGELTEEARINVRQIRQEKIKSIDDLKEEKKISEDEHEDAKEYIQELIDKANEQIEEIKKSKIAALSS